MSFWKGFLFTHSQKIGLLGLVALLGLGMAGIAWYRYHESQPKEVDISLALPSVKQKKTQIPSEPDIHLDINIADSTAWTTLRGIGPVLSSRILRYRKARNGFRSVQELKKVYGLKPEVFEAIAPLLYVDGSTIPAKREANTRSFSQKPIKLSPIDLNQATAEELQVLRGIGPVLSERIVTYRTAIGGFEEITQLRKVYGLKPEVFDEIHPYLYLSASETVKDSVSPGQPIASHASTNQRLAAPSPDKSLPVSRVEADLEILDLNAADSSQLVQLPGIGAWTASQILRYRSRIGYFVSVEQLKDIPRLSEENFQRMSPYLSLEDGQAFPTKDLNRASEWTLKVHGPISDSLAMSIVSYRKQLGRFSSWQELRKVPQIEDATISYLRKYFHL